MEKKKLYGVLIQAEVFYEIEAENADEAENIALGYFDDYLPYVKITEIDEKE